MSFSTSNMLGVDLGNDIVVDPAVPEIPGPLFAPGTRAFLTNGGEAVLVENGTGSALVVGDVVFFSTAYVATLLSTANDARGQLVGVALAATAASTSTVKRYVWAQVKGTCAAMNVLASCAANARLNTTATAGSLDDDGTTGAMVVDGVTLSTARAASNGPAPAVLNYPSVGVTL